MFELVQIAKLVFQVALLCGSPGLGKTTLAHVIATHAGYSVVEMNARSERRKAVQGKAESSTYGKALLYSSAVMIEVQSCFKTYSSQQPKCKPCLQIPQNQTVWSLTRLMGHPRYMLSRAIHLLLGFQVVASLLLTLSPII